MTSQQQVMVGLTATALIAALTLNDFWPGWASAIIILAVGISFTYYIGLNGKRLEQIEKLSFLLEKGKRIYGENSTPKLLAELNYTAKRVTDADFAFTWLASVDQPGESFYDLEHEEMQLDKTGWQEVVDCILNNHQTLVINDAGDSGFKQVFADGTIDSLLAIPLKNGDLVMGILCLFNQAGHKPFTLNDQKVTEAIGYYASRGLVTLAEKKEMKNIYVSTLKAISRAVEAHEPGFTGHAERVGKISVAIGRKLGLTEDEARAVEYGALLHDIGKIAVTVESNLEPPGNIQPVNQENNVPAGEQHPVRGADIFPDTSFFIPIKEAILYHHERYNGTGYPEGKEKNDIPFPARIIAVADVYDALTRLCPEEERLDHYQALGVIKKATGTLFDPLVVVALEEVEEEVLG